MALTVEDLRQRITSSLEDEALEAMLDAAYESIDEVAGPAGDVTEWLPRPAGDRLMLSRPATEIVTVTERLYSTDLELEDDDFEFIGNETLRRLITGTNPYHCWREAIVVYTPVLTDAGRDRVAVDLINLELTFQPGLVGQRLGEWSEQYGQGSDGSYEDTRAAILNTLGVPIPLL